MPMIPQHPPAARAVPLRAQIAIRKPAPRQEPREEQIAPEPARWPVIPHGVYVARRDQFDLSAHSDLTGEQIIVLAFDLLPLREHGWAINRTSINRIHGNIWSIRRV